jgi:hypothetical protein
MNLHEWEQAFSEYIQGGTSQQASDGAGPNGAEASGSGDGSHDIGHFRRVWRMCRQLQEMEGGQC